MRNPDVSRQKAIYVAHLSQRRIANEAAGDLRAKIFSHPTVLGSQNSRRAGSDGGRFAQLSPSHVNSYSAASWLQYG